MVALVVLGLVGYRWARSTIGTPINWQAFSAVTDGMRRLDVVAVLGEPTETGDNYLRWWGSNGAYLVQFDRLGFVVGRARDVDPQAGVKRLWRSCGLPAGWLPYLAELRRP
jgi:hypothetical protein